MNLNLDTIAEKAAEAISKELDESLPDGVIQAGTGQLVSALGKVLTKVGEKLAEAENTDGDK